jgi:ATP-dependent helicase/nuclease subunit B
MAQPLNLFTIPPGASFADELARGVLARFAVKGDPLAVSRLLILVPTRRAIGAVGEAFARVAEGPIAVLPRIRALGDFDDAADVLGAEDDFAGDDMPELPPPITKLRRELLLTALIKRWSVRVDAALSERTYGAPPALALVLARDLAGLLDQAAAEGLDWRRLKDIVPAELATHWHVTIEFLKIVTEAWPALLAAEKASDPVSHRDAALRRAAARWSAKPPLYPVIAAGSTGSVPATAALLKAIAGMAKGAVVLPGLDLDTADEEWKTLPPGHPQAGMCELIEKFGATRRDVEPWTDAPGNVARAALLREALRPSEATAGWQAAIGMQQGLFADAVNELRMVAARTPAEEAQVIALALRRAVETPAKTAALVTPNRSLARRVAAELARWHIDIDDSAGEPLSKSIPGRFLSLVAEVAAERLAPVPLLALLKHPLTTLGYRERADVRSLAERFEREVLRGPRPSPGFDGLRAALSDDEKRRFGEIIDQLEQAFGDFSAEDMGGPLPLESVVERHRAAAERIAAGWRGHAGELWEHAAGRVAGDLFTALAAAAPNSGIALTGREYVDFIRTLMDAAPVRPRFGRHPRLHIWGPLEARLQRADLMILGGLNEGVWPPQTDPGPWLSRPMREELGLSQPERRVGLSAHDFAQAASGAETLLTRAEKEGGSPTTAARWLTRLGIVLEGAGLKHAFEDGELLSIARALDHPAQVRPIAPPRPCPPLAARPRALAVTDIERWIRDPYALYARSILKLKRLDPLDDTPAAAERGMAIHGALDLFAKKYPDLLPDDEIAFDALCEAGREAFGKMLTRPGVKAFWWPRFERMARWLLAYERPRRTEGARVVSEVVGKLELPACKFTLSAKADRVDIWPDGTVSIVDYKTGQAPTAPQIVRHLAPQIPLEGAIALGGGFPIDRPTGLRELLIIKLKGDSKGGDDIDVRSRDAAPEDIARGALSGLIKRVGEYDDPKVPYISRLRVVLERVEGDYDHLARFKEWSSGDDNDW